MNLRILIVAGCPYPAPGGSQVLIASTATALLRAGHAVRIVSFGHGTGESDALIVRARALPGTPPTAPGPSWTRPLHDLALVFALRRELRRAPVDIVHAHNYEGLAAALSVGARPLVYHAHTAFAEELPAYFPRLLGARALGRWCDTCLPRRAEAIIAPHASLAEYLVRCGCPESRVHVVPPPISVDIFESKPVSLNLAPVLYAGNLDQYQNLPLLEHAVALARQEEPGLRFVVVTSQRGGRVAGAEVRQTDDFREVKAWLEADVVVACPRSSPHGYPMKLLNAMAAGRPCVACAGAAHPIRDGVSGRVVADGDAASFARALLELARSPSERERLGENARAAAMENHDLDRIAALLAEVYDIARREYAPKESARRRGRAR